jgi:hypothetical protein
MFLAWANYWQDDKTSMVANARQYSTFDAAEAAAFLYAATRPELLGRFEIVVVKYRDEGYGKMKPYWERV